MEFKIKYDVSDIAAELKDEVKAAVVAEFELAREKLVHELEELIKKQADSLASALAIDKPRDKERVERALAFGLKKWAKEVLRNGSDG